MSLEKIERVEENSMGTNSNVINNIISFINSSKQSNHENIKYFLDNLDKMSHYMNIFAKNVVNEEFMLKKEYLGLI